MASGRRKIWRRAKPINRTAGAQLRRYPIVKDKRPVNLDMLSIRLPITAWASITHRATGVFLFAGIALLLWALDASLASPESFASLQERFNNPLLKLIIWAVMAALIYHSLAGIKHLIMDMGIGETMAGGVLGARIVIALSVVFILVAGIWIW
jgi:succinate dehydrogenase / fumarate reductase, cytochrome b subunit